jgi:hypothetical protein
MIWTYASDKLSAQAKAVAFVVVYLLVSQIFILRVPVQGAVAVALGIGAIAAGLAFFLEGLFLGIMPLGEQCGLRLPAKAGPVAVSVFSLVVGVTATLAEPAIGILKAQGSAVKPWEAPLLYFLLNRGSGLLVAAVAVGVGIAVVVGVLRFLYGWSFKPLVFLSLPLLVLTGFLFQRDPLLRPVAGLAWDTGGVTTGPVTVPLVIALGVGVSRIAGGKRGGVSGLGVVTLASALPVATVFILALALAPRFPAPGPQEAFFSADGASRSRAEFVFGGPDALAAARSAAESGAGRVSAPSSGAAASAAAARSPVSKTAIDSLVAVLPLALVLILTLSLLLRERLRNADEVLLGLGFAVVGMFVFNLGMANGLSPLGSQAGAALPRAYQTTVLADQEIVLRGVVPSSVFASAGPAGPAEYLWIEGADGPEAVRFDPDRWDQAAGVYRHVPVRPAIFASWGRFGGIAAALVFLFVLGFGATLAEPSLAALGITVEELTTGTYRKSSLVLSVAVGVGLGMIAGFVRILFDLPLSWMLAVPYAGALILTVFSTEDFAAIAWDSAGVTTGPITVPLVIAAGLGIGAQSGASGSFGVVACASVYPVLTVLSTGLFARARARLALGSERALLGGGHDRA